jgi:uncharacterized cupredoxin-like copper-binding protein
MSNRRLGWLGGALVASGFALIAIGSLISAATGSSARTGWAGPGMMGGPGVTGRGMTGGAWGGVASAPGPGELGFVAGTAAAPRVVRIVATPHLRFQPDVVTIEAGETITFEVTTMGPTVHEFMVGPAADVATDKAGTAEVAEIGMMQTGSVTYTFTGSGPFAFACHAPGHYEAGMTGTITIQ